MRALIDSALFRPQAIEASNLISFFQLALEGRHVVLPEPYDAPEFKDWLQRRDPQIREECRFAIDMSLDLLKRFHLPFDLRVTLAKEPRWLEPAELPPELALVFLRQPLDVVVENGRNDQPFLLAVADRYQREALVRALSEHRIRFDHGGGLREMWQRIKETQEESMSLRRSFWIFDSDAMSLGRASPPSDELREECLDRKVAHYQLRRRAAENYLPIPAIRELWALQKRDKKKRLRAFEKLNASQRHYFNMKNGIKGDEKILAAYTRKDSTRNLAKEAVDLYKDLPEGIRNALREGFDRKIRDLFKDERLSQEDGWFEKDGSREEMRPVIEQLLGRI